MRSRLAHHISLLLWLALLVAGAGCGGSDGGGGAAGKSGGKSPGKQHGDAAVDMTSDAAADGGNGGSSTAGTGAAGTGGNGSTMDADASLPVSADCPAPAVNQPPETLSCTGLYADIAKKTLSNGVHEFAPAVPLWSDGAEKKRWMWLPPGTKIDVSDPDAWKFPVGTHFWKEFSRGGKRVETRLFWKQSDFFWARTAYKWNADESEATRSGGEDFDVGGSPYHIPSTTECDQCHKGRVDRALGFETILLGLDGSTGMTLAELKKQDLLTGGTLPDKITIGDDGSGFGSDALPWLHVNCGVSCHNGNPASEAYQTNLRMRLLVADADGSSTKGVDTLETTVGVKATTGRWMGQTRIIAGMPDKSLLYSLMSTRNATNMKDQMPPIASRVVPKDGAKLISDWITNLP